MCKGNNNWGMPQDGIADTLTYNFHTLTVLPTLNIFAYTSYLLDKLSVSAQV